MALGKPSEAPQGAGLAQFEGATCVFTYRERGEANSKEYGLKKFVAADVLVVEGNVGRKSTQTKIGQEIKDLSARPGDFHENVRIFQGFVRGAFNGQEPGGLIGGRVVVRFEDTQQGKNQPVWHLDDLTPAEEQAAERMIEAHAAKHKPSVSAPSAAPAQDEPAF